MSGPPESLTARAVSPTPQRLRVTEVHDNRRTDPSCSNELDVAPIARGGVDLKTEVVEMAEVVAMAIEIASSLSEARWQVLTVNVPRRGLWVDRVRYVSARSCRSCGECREIRGPKAR